MKTYAHKVDETASFLETYVDKPPQVAILTGTGLGAVVEPVRITTVLDYGDIPNFPRSTVQTHHGRLIIGEIDDKPVIAMQGRFHLYEGYAPQEVTFPIRVFQALGIETLIISNAAGAVNLSYDTGDIMIIRDHINLTGSNPLVGLKEDRWGERFPDMQNAYDTQLAELAADIGRQAGLSPKEGIYAGLLGPSLETPAEIRWLKMMGVDAVGFSTVHEVIAAVQASMRVLAFSIITNINNPDLRRPHTVADIIDVARTTAPLLGDMIEKLVPKVSFNHRRTER